MHLAGPFASPSQHPGLFAVRPGVFEHFGFRGRIGHDTEADPHEIHNLASDPEHFDKLAELRSAHLRWTEETRDLGHITEAELIRRLWPPDGVQPTTADPVITSVAEGPGRQVRITCASPGAAP